MLIFCYKNVVSLNVSLQNQKKKKNSTGYQKYHTDVIIFLIIEYLIVNSRNADLYFHFHSFCEILSNLIHVSILPLTADR